MLHIHCLQFPKILFTFVMLLITKMNSRLLKFLNAENITQAQFADSIGVARASISHIISGRNKPGYDFISAMMEKYPQLNPEWLILGKGKMYKEIPKSQTALPDPSTEDLLFPSYETEPQQDPAAMAPIPSKMNESPKIFPDSPQQIPNAPEVQDVPKLSAVQESPSQNLNLNLNQSARRVTKAIVFFDDGTFQELRTIFGV